jgi:phospholipid/cholesterol/gamma-HCH transport system substrate-binding protein
LLNDSVVAIQLREIVANLNSSSIKLDDNLEAMQHNFLLRGFFRKRARQEEAARKEQREREAKEQKERERLFSGATGQKVSKE